MYIVVLLARYCQMASDLCSMTSTHCRETGGSICRRAGSPGVWSWRRARAARAPRPSLDRSAATPPRVWWRLARARRNTHRSR